MHPPVINISTPPPPNNGADGAVETASSPSFSSCLRGLRLCYWSLGAARSRSSTASTSSTSLQLIASTAPFLRRSKSSIRRCSRTFTY
ncbi:hypothetical protein ACFX1Q_042961 [Malus domestica]